MGLLLAFFLTFLHYLCSQIVDLLLWSLSVGVLIHIPFVRFSSETTINTMVIIDDSSGIYECGITIYFTVCYSAMRPNTFGHFALPEFYEIVHKPH